MTIRLLKGIEFRATVRPNSIQGSGGRPGLKLVNHSVIDHKNTRFIFERIAKELKAVLAGKAPDIIKATEIKATKKMFLETIKEYEIKE